MAATIGLCGGDDQCNISTGLRRTERIVLGAAARCLLAVGESKVNMPY